MTNLVQQSPYLREQRDFPKNSIESLAQQSDQAYIEVANKMNNRTISTFATNYPIITGEKWYLAGSTSETQTLRQTYTITSLGGTLHNIANFAKIPYFSRMYGQYTDGSNWYGFIPAGSTAIAGQRSFFLNPTTIVFVAGSAPPAFVKGVIVLEWLSIH